MERDVEPLQPRQVVRADLLLDVRLRHREDLAVRAREHCRFARRLDRVQHGREQLRRRCRPGSGPSIPWSRRRGHLASSGTQKTPFEMYSSRSSSDSSSPAYSESLSRTSLAISSRRSSNESEMYLRKIRPRTTCLYSAASMLERSLSAASQSLASKPSEAEEFFANERLLSFDRAIPGEKLVEFSPVSSGKEQRIRNGVESPRPNSAQADSGKFLYCAQNSWSYVQMNIRPSVCLFARQKRYNGHFRGGNHSLRRLGETRGSSSLVKLRVFRATLRTRICEGIAGFAGSGNMLLVKGRPRLSTAPKATGC